METTTLIIIALGVILLIGIHSWLHKLIKFKIDESAIVNFLKESAKKEGGTQFSLEDIAQSTKLKAARVAVICQQSKEVRPVHNTTLWGLAQ